MKIKIIIYFSNKKVVVFCTQDVDKIFNEDAFTATIKLLEKIIIGNKSCFFIIKVHPREEIKKYNTAFKKMPKGNYKILKDINLHKLYKITDVQVSLPS